MAKLLQQETPRPLSLQGLPESPRSSWLSRPSNEPKNEDASLGEQKKEKNVLIEQISLEVVSSEVEQKEEEHSASPTMSECSFHRVDIELKKAIRALRRYFRNHFKIMHPELISKRIVN